MMMFIAHIAFVLALMAFAAGLVVLHNGRQAQSLLVKTAGLLLILLGLGNMVCTGYWANHYYKMGYFNTMDMDGKGPHCKCNEEAK